MITSVINHPQKSPLVMLRAGFKKICDGNIPAAVLLSIIEYWTNIKIEAEKQVNIENNARKKEGVEIIKYDYWIYKTNYDFQFDSIGLLKEHDVREGLKIILRKSYVFKRNNPKYKWDRTPQYLLNINLVNNELQALNRLQTVDAVHSEYIDNRNGTGAESRTNISTIEAEYIDNRNGTDNEAIPEITTNKTTTTNQIVVVVSEIEEKDIKKLQGNLTGSKLEGIEKSFLSKMVNQHGFDKVESTLRYLSSQYALSRRDIPNPTGLVLSILEGGMDKPTTVVRDEQAKEAEKQEAEKRKKKRDEIERIKKEREMPEECKHTLDQIFGRAEV